MSDFPDTPAERQRRHSAPHFRTEGRTLPDEGLRSLEDAQVELGNLLYRVGLLYEYLEHEGRVRGNGHHMAQELSQFGTELLARQWVVEPCGDTAEVPADVEGQ